MLPTNSQSHALINVATPLTYTSKGCRKSKDPFNSS